MATIPASSATGSDVHTGTWTGRYSWKSMAAGWLAGTLAAFAIVGILLQLSDANVHSLTIITGIGIIALIWAALLGHWAVRFAACRYRLTDRLVERYIFGHTRRVDLVDIDSIHVVQGPIQRLLDCGHVVIRAGEPGDADHSTLVLAGINGVSDFLIRLDDAHQSAGGS